MPVSIMHCICSIRKLHHSGGLGQLMGVALKEFMLEPQTSRYMYIQ